MFTVRMPAAAEVSQNLQQLAGKLDQQIDEVEGIVSRLRKIFEYDEVRHMLRQYLENMRLEKYRMQELAAALDEIQLTYHLVEDRITVYGDELHWANQNRSIRSAGSGSTGKTIQAYHIR